MNDILRLATRDDAQAIARLSRDRIEHGLAWSWTTPRVLRSIRDRETNALVAVDTFEAVQGFGIMKYQEDEAHLLLLAVRSDRARRGVGGALVDWLERSARVAGIARITLEARASNAEARAFYRRLGYMEIQSLPGYYQGVEACVRLAKELRVAPGVVD